MGRELYVEVLPGSTDPSADVLNLPGTIDVVTALVPETTAQDAIGSSSKGFTAIYLATSGPTTGTIGPNSFIVTSNNNLSLGMNNNARVVITATEFRPQNDAGISLGATDGTKSFLALRVGDSVGKGVINFDGSHNVQFGSASAHNVKFLYNNNTALWMSSGSLYPATDGAYDLGGGSKGWGDLYLSDTVGKAVAKFDASHRLELGTTSNHNVRLLQNNALALNVTSTYVYVSKDLVPDSDANRTLGTADIVWSDAYIGNGTNNAHIDETEFLVNTGANYTIGSSAANDVLFVQNSNEAFRAQSSGLTLGSLKYLRLASFTDAQRGAAGTAGRVIFNTDDGQLNIDDGTNWTLPDGTTT